jgi:hypothetical protein
MGQQVGGAMERILVGPQAAQRKGGFGACWKATIDQQQYNTIQHKTILLRTAYSSAPHSQLTLLSLLGTTKLQHIGLYYKEMHSHHQATNSTRDMHARNH